MPVQDIVAIYTGLINLAIKSYENNTSYVDKVLESTELILNNMNLDHIQTNTPLSKELIKLLKTPIDLYKNVLIILNLKHYSTLYEHLDYVGRKSMCQHLINNALENESLISTSEDVELLLQIINPLIQDPVDKPSDYEQDNEDFIDEQTLVAKLLHLMYTENLDQQYLVKKFFILLLSLLQLSLI
jgi:vacuolar protein sorting-associated protein 35